MHKPRELNQKGEKTGKPIGKHVISLYSTGISQIFKIKNEKKITARYWEWSDHQILDT